jgi:hypothetical protein
MDIVKYAEDSDVRCIAFDALENINFWFNWHKTGKYVD